MRASFCKEVMRVCRIGNLRVESFGASVFLVFGVEVVSRGKALERRVDNESIMMREVFGGGCVEVRLRMRAMRWARVGIEKWVRFERSVDRSLCGELDVDDCAA